MKTKTNQNQTVPALQEWAHSENRFLSHIVGRTVSNFNALRFWSVIVPAMLTFVSLCSGNLFFTALTGWWTYESYQIGKKGGRA